jgi:hypothetical protein
MAIYPIRGLISQLRECWGTRTGIFQLPDELWRGHLHSGSGQRYMVWRKGRGVMIESIMYFGVGFLVAALLGLLFIPLVHNRAVRLTMKRLEASTPLSISEIRADKDQLRAEFAVSTRRLEDRKAESANDATACRTRQERTPSISLRKSWLRTRRRIWRWRREPGRCAISCAPPKKNYRRNQTRSSKRTVNSPITRLSWRRCGPNSASDLSSRANLGFRFLARRVPRTGHFYDKGFKFIKTK